MDSPFFHPTFAGAVHDVFGDVQVATHEGQQVWFPLQERRGMARPVGVPGSDFNDRWRRRELVSTR